MTVAVLSRIALRYISGYLVFKGLVPQEIADMIANDPELAAALGVAIMVVAEGAYALAKRLGWST